MTGKEIFEAGICTAMELGELCWEGKITAWDETGAATYSSSELWEEMKCGAHSWTVIPFPFGMAEYAKEFGGPGLAMASEYKSDLSRMYFEVDEIKKVFTAKKDTPKSSNAFSASLPAGQTLPQSGQPDAEPSPPADGERTYIPRDLWAQKPLQQVCDDMRAAGFKDDAVAYALFHWRGVSNKTELGKLLRGGDMTDGAYYKYAGKQLGSSRQWETDR